MRLRVKNFKQFRSAEWILPDRGLVLIKGASGRGKTTVFEAIYAAITGDAGNSAPWSGEKPTEIELVFKDLDIIRTKRPESLKAFGAIDDVAQEMIYRYLGMNGQEFEVSSYIRQMSRGAILLMSPADQLRFIQKLAFGDQDPEIIKKKILNLISKRQEEINYLELQIKTQTELKIKIEQLLASNNLQESRPISPFDENTANKYIKRLEKIQKIEQKLRDKLSQVIDMSSRNEYNLLQKYMSQATSHESTISALSMQLSEFRNQLNKMGEPWVLISRQECEQYISLFELKEKYLEWKNKVLEFIEYIKKTYQYDGQNKALDFLQNYAYQLDDKIKELNIQKENAIIKINEFHNALRGYECPKCKSQLSFQNQSLVLISDGIDKEKISNDLDKLQKNINQIDSQIKDLTIIKENVISDIKILSELQKQKINIENKQILDNDVPIKHPDQLKKYMSEQLELSAKKSYIENEISKLTASIDAEHNLYTEKMSKIKELTNSLIPKNELDQKIRKLSTTIDTVRKRRDYIQSEIDRWKKYIQEIDYYNKQKDIVQKYKNEIQETEKVISNLNTALTEAKNLWSADQRLKEISNVAAILATESIINEINQHAQYYIDQMFPEGGTIVQLLSGYKTKSGDERAKLSINVIHRGIPAGKSINVLSGGEQDRVILAFQLAMSDMYDSPILMVDEGFTGVDVAYNTLHLCLNLLKEISRNKLVLVIQHGAPEGIFDQIIEI